MLAFLGIIVVAALVVTRFVGIAATGAGLAADRASATSSPTT